MKGESIARFVGTWVALLALLAATCATSYVSMGRINVVVNLAIAAVKALLVVFMFMHLRNDRPTVRLVAVAGFAWLALLAGLSLGDFLTRGP
jgi:cytochrome c oxidase subunit 4